MAEPQFPKPKSFDEQPTQPQQPQQPNGAPTGATLPDSVARRAPLDQSGIFATSRAEDFTDALLEGKGINTYYTTDSARRRVIQQRINAQQAEFAERDILTWLHQEVGYENLSDEEYASVASIIGAPGLGMTERLLAIQEQQQASWAEDFMREYNPGAAGGFMLNLEEGDLSIAQQAGKALTMGFRRRDMWNELDRDQREFLTRNYGLKAPTILRGRQWDEDAGALSMVDATVTTALSAAWTPVKALIGAFDYTWRSTNRTYRGRNVLENEADPVRTDLADNEAIDHDRVGGLIGRGLDKLSGVDDHYEQKIGHQLAVPRVFLLETGKWLGGALNPLKFKERWAAGGSLGGEDSFLPSEVERARNDWALDESGLATVLGVAARRDSSVFGSPTYDYKQRETAAGRFGTTIAAFTGAGSNADVDSQALEANAVEADFQRAIDEYLMEEFPGKSPEEAEARAAARTLYLNSETIRQASADLAKNGKVSMGRQIAMRMGHAPGTREFQILSGYGDIYSNLVADPTSFAGPIGRVGRMTRAITASDSVRNVERIQDTFEGVYRTQGGMTVKSPVIGSGLRRSLDDVTVAVTDGINARMNSHEYLQQGVMEDLMTGKAPEVLADPVGRERGYDLLARNQPRWEPYYGRLVDYAYDRVMDAGTNWADANELIKVEGGRYSLQGDIPQQIIVDWLKEEEGLLAIVNGRLGGVMGKTPTLPSDGMMNLLNKTIKRKLALTIDNIDDVPSRVVNRLADQGAFDDHGADVLGRSIERLEAERFVSGDEATELRKLLSERPKADVVPRPFINKYRAVIDKKMDELAAKADKGDANDLAAWAELSIIAAKLDSPNAFRSIGVNSTGILSQPNLLKSLHAIKVMQGGDITAIRKLGLGVGAVAWSAAIRTANYLPRAISISTPSRHLRFLDEHANSVVRNYAAQLPSTTRANMANIFASVSNEADKITLARNILVESFDMMGFPYTEAGRRFLGKNMNLFDSAGGHRYSSSSSRNYITMPNGEQVASAIRETDLAPGMMLPDMREMLEVSQKLQWWHNLSPVAMASTLLNNRLTDGLMGTFWTPSVLFRLGHPFRTTGDETFSYFMREGMSRFLMGRLAESSQSSKTSLFPQVARIDKVILRGTFYYPRNLPGIRHLGGEALEVRLAKTLGIPEEHVAALVRANRLGQDSGKGAAAARREIMHAISNSNPYELMAHATMSGYAAGIDFFAKQIFRHSDTARGERALKGLLNHREDALHWADENQLPWGPKRITEAVREVQARITPREHLQRTRFMHVHSGDSSAHIRSRDETLAVGRGAEYNNEHVGVLGEPGPFETGGRSPHPDDRFRDFVQEDYEVLAREGQATPEFVDAWIGEMERNLDSSMTRLVFDTLFKDNGGEFGYLLQQQKMPYGEWRALVLTELARKFKDDPEMVETLLTRMNRGATTPSGKVVLYNTEEEYNLFASLSEGIASLTEFRRQRAANPNAQFPLKDESLEGLMGKTREEVLGSGYRTLDERAEFAGARDELVRRAVDPFLGDDGWNLRVLPENEALTGGRLSATNTQASEVILSPAAVMTDYEAGLRFWRGEATSPYESMVLGQSLEGTGVDADDLLAWFESNGGAETYYQFVALREQGRVALGKSPTKIPDPKVGEALTPEILRDAVLSEAEASEYAYAAMGMPFGRPGVVDTFLYDEIIEARKADEATVAAERLRGELGGLLEDANVRDMTEVRGSLESFEQTLGSVRTRAQAAEDPNAPQFDRLVAYMDEMEVALREAGHSPENIIRLWDELTQDGLYVSSTLGGGYWDIVHEVEQGVEAHFVNVLDFDRIGDFPITDEMIGAVQDYLAYKRRHLPDEFSPTFYDDVEDSAVLELMDSVSREGIGGIDDDVLALFDRFLEPEAGTNGARVRSAAEADLPPRGGPPALNRATFGPEMERLAGDISLGRVAPPSVAIDEHVETLLAEVEEAIYSSPRSVANDLSTGKYQTAPNMSLYTVTRDEAGEVSELKKMDIDAMKRMSPDTEMIELGDDATIADVRNNQTFLPPMDSTDYQAAIDGINDALMSLFERLDPDDPAMADILAHTPHNYDDLIAYAGFVRQKTGKPTDKALDNIIEMLAEKDVRQDTNVAVAARRLINGLGTDTEAPRRLSMTVERFERLINDHDAGLPLFDESEIYGLAERSNMLPDATYRARKKAVFRNPFAEMVRNGFTEWSGPIVDYLNRSPMINAHFYEGWERAYPLLMENRPDLKAVVETIMDSDRAIPNIPGNRTRMSGNGYVSMKEIREDLKSLVAKQKDEALDAPVVTSSHPVLGPMLKQARLDPRALNNSAGKWFHQTLLPKLVDEFPPIESTTPMTLPPGSHPEGYVFRISERSNEGDLLVEGSRNTFHSPEETKVVLGRATGSLGIKDPVVVVYRKGEEVPVGTVDKTKFHQGKYYPPEQGESVVRESLDDYLPRVMDRVIEGEETINDAAMTRAHTQMLAFTDNEAVSSYFSLKFRNMFPFRWAEERFIKRVFMTAAANPAGVQRGLFVFRGLTTSTIPDEDQHGNKVFVYPFSAMAADKVMEFTGRFGENRTNFKMPDDTMGFGGAYKDVLPGTMDSSFVPSTPSHFIAWTGRGVARQFPSMEGVVSELIGEYASDESRAAWSLILPSSIIRAMTASDPDEVRAMYADKVFIVMAYMENAGLTPDMDDPEAKKEYLDAVRNWTEVLAWQSAFWGFAGVSAPKVQVLEDSPQAHFRNYISQYGFDKGIEQFMTDYPDETLFTMFQTESSGGAAVPATRQVYDFLSANEDILDNHPAAAGFLVPSPEYTSDFYRPAWNKMNDLGIRRDKEWTGKDWIEGVADDFAFQSVANEYFDTVEAYEAGIEEAKRTGDDAVKKYLKDELRKYKFDTRQENETFAIVLDQRDSPSTKRKNTLLELRNLRELVREGDERAVKMYEGNRRMQLSFELLQSYDDYLAVNAALPHHDNRKKEDDLTFQVNKQAFLEDGSARVRENRAELESLWHRVIVPEVGGITQEDLDNNLIGLES